MRLPKNCQNRIKIKLNYPLSRHTTFRLGGKAEYFIKPCTVEDLKLLLKCLKRYNISYSIIGLGSNLLISDQGKKGAVIQLSAPFFKKIKKARNFIEAGAGCPLGAVVSYAVSLGLGGFEFLSGIPGTVGGAIVGNAGQAYKKRWMQDIVLSVTVMDAAGKIKAIPRDRIKFAYRASNLGKYIILSARFRFKAQKKEVIRRMIKDYCLYRRKKQLVSGFSAGCVFKNPKSQSAGKLIDACGLKGKRIGGAYISAKHANFIINDGRAKTSDILSLMDLARLKVKRKFGIELQPEIKIWK
ncbi:MAG: UDP-N-acetylmuramate dehydrogenase [Candidatus Omnitrophica bacterium]|jgi:UDP-N-acetylmuramate dehydrogenase|nr:UDP-N-acetylmuramate dehydrogenase [Candidatus Omnitrophota bacterium]